MSPIGFIIASWMVLGQVGWLRTEQAHKSWFESTSAKLQLVFLIIVMSVMFAILGPFSILAVERFKK